MSTVSVPKPARPRPARPAAFRPAPPKRRGGWGRFAWVAGVALLAASLLGARHVLQVGGAAAQPAATPVPASTSSRIVCHGIYDVDLPPTLLGPTAAGRVKEVFVKDFDTVKKGQRLLTLDDQAVTDAIAQATIGVQVAEAQLREAEQALAQHAKMLDEQAAAIQAAERKAAAAKLDSRAAIKAIVGNVVTQEQADAKTELAEAAAVAVTAERAKLATLQAARPTNKVDQAARGVDLARARLEKAEHARRDFVVEAPDDGMVLRVGLAIGSVVGPQSRDVPVLFVPAAAKRVVRVELDQEVAYKVKVGCTAEVSDKYDRGALWAGKVVAIAEAYLPRRGSAGAIVAGPDVKVLECLVELDATNGQPRLNQPMTVAIHPPAK